MERRAGKVVAMGVTAAIVAQALLVAPARALAVEDGSIEALAAQVEQSLADYEAIHEQVDELQGRIDENEARVGEIEAALPEQRRRAAVGVRTLYKFSQVGNGLIELLLSADDFNGFISTWQYLGIVQERNKVEIDRLVTMEDELEETRRQLKEQKDEADERLAEARAALEAAEEARDEARRRAAEQAAREAAEAQAAREAAARAAEEAARAAAESAVGATFTTSTGNEAPIAVGEDPGQAIITNDDVASWAARIDGYLAGSPLEGRGKTFAAAALSSGVDPRWSPAISCIESSKGRYCFRSHNAWGWGSVNWPDWDTAIREHVSGLAHIYGYSITPSAAKMYCPPNWQYWYSSVCAEMAKI